MHIAFLCLSPVTHQKGTREAAIAGSIGGLFRSIIASIRIARAAAPCRTFRFLSRCVIGLTFETPPPMQCFADDFGF
jgi:hypothetical protein